MPTVSIWAHAAYLWLAAVNPLLPWVLLVFFPCFVVPWALRRWLPNFWEAIPGFVDGLSADVGFKPDGGLAKFLAKIFQALPSAIMGAVASALALGTSPGEAAKGALAGACAPLMHELLKALPWIPYVGGVAPAAGTKPKAAKAPILPILLLCLLPVLPATLSSCGIFHSAVTALDTIRTVVDDLDDTVRKIDGDPQLKAFLAAAPADVRKGYATSLAEFWDQSQAIHALADAGDAANAGNLVTAVAKSKEAWLSFVSGLGRVGINVKTGHVGAAQHFAAARGQCVIVVPAPVAARASR